MATGRVVRRSKTRAATTTKTTARKTTAKRPPSKTTTARKTAGRSAATRTTSSRTTPLGPMNVHGFREGSDSAMIVDLMIKGGKDRPDINEQIRKQLDKAGSAETRSGNPKNAPSLVAGLLSKMLAQGYKVESSWRLVPPAKVQRQLEKAAQNGTATRKPAKRAPARRVKA